jgi:hypothetical protein
VDGFRNRCLAFMGGFFGIMLGCFASRFLRFMDFA